MVYQIPESVYNYLKNTSPCTVKDLYDLANFVLGGGSIPGVKLPSLSDVGKAVDAINNAFDECRVLAGFFSPADFKSITSDLFIPAFSTTLVKGEESAEQVVDIIPETRGFNEANITVYPNPFTTVVKFEIEVTMDTHVRLEIYSHAGSLLKVVLNEDLIQGDIRIVEFDASRYPHTTFLYRLVTNYTMKSGTIIRTKPN